MPFIQDFSWKKIKNSVNLQDRIFYYIAEENDEIQHPAG